ncbi:MAG: TetR/AcrR family transcriptional regulator [Clostridiales bacterium]|nr:TetR/AcrR family transcriptional regulator [Clostridiales bacterium]
MANKHYCKEAFARADKERKNIILEVGIDEFASKGYENANVNVIAKKAGISIGLMYKYFATKEDLFITCLQRGTKVLEDALYDIMKSDDKLLVKAEKLIRTMACHSKQNSNYIKMYNEITAERDLNRAKAIVEEIEFQRSRIYIKSITDALETGDVRTDLDPKMFSFFLDNLLSSLLFSYTCDYYRERFRVYTGIDIREVDDETVVNQLLKFIESAFTYEKQ